MHKATYEVINYPRTSYPHTVRWTCTCGKIGQVIDGARGGASIRRARTAHKRHVAHAFAKGA